MASEHLYGGIEAGGTKFICAVGSDPSDIIDEARIETTTPDETLARVIHFFERHASSGRIKTLGVGSFGPVDLKRDSPTYGFITSTPKPGWRNTDILGPLKSALEVPIALDTDVDVAALGEATWGASCGFEPSLYLTIGTGIGGGFIQNGVPLQGMSHPEMGHLRIVHNLELDDYPGNCPFHGDCFEGLASGPAIERRFDRRPESIPDDDPFWDIEAGYIAAAVASYILVLSPAIIVLGGGIMQRRFMFPSIRRAVLASLNSYVQCAPLLEHIDDYIVPPGLGSKSGVLGALALARLADPVSQPNGSRP